MESVSLCLRSARWIWASRHGGSGETESASGRSGAAASVLRSRPERVQSLQPVTGRSCGHLRSFRVINLLQDVCAPSQLAPGGEHTSRLCPNTGRRSDERTLREESRCCVHCSGRASTQETAALTGLRFPWRSPIVQQCHLRWSLYMRNTPSQSLSSPPSTSAKPSSL